MYMDVYYWLKEEQPNHELFIVCSANYNQNLIRGFSPPEDTIKKMQMQSNSDVI